MQFLWTTQLSFPADFRSQKRIQIFPIKARHAPFPVANTRSFLAHALGRTRAETSFLATYSISGGHCRPAQMTEAIWG
jgi:hypothetical protein